MTLTPSQQRTRLQVEAIEERAVPAGLHLGAATVEFSAAPRAVEVKVQDHPVGHAYGLLQHALGESGDGNRPRHRDDAPGQQKKIDIVVGETLVIEPAPTKQPEKKADDVKSSAPHLKTDPEPAEITVTSAGISITLASPVRNESPVRAREGAKSTVASATTTGKPAEHQDPQSAIHEVSDREPEAHHVPTTREVVALEAAVSAPVAAAMNQAPRIQAADGRPAEPPLSVAPRPTTMAEWYFTSASLDSAADAPVPMPETPTAAEPNDPSAAEEVGTWVPIRTPLGDFVTRFVPMDPQAVEEAVGRFIEELRQLRAAGDAWINEYQAALLTGALAMSLAGGELARRKKLPEKVKELLRRSRA